MTIKDLHESKEAKLCPYKAGQCVAMSKQPETNQANRLKGKTRGFNSSESG